MIYCKMQMMLNERIKGITEETKSKDYALLGTTLNQSFERMKYEENPVAAYVSDLNEENVVVVLSKLSEDVLERVCHEVQNKVEHSLAISVTIKSVVEITVEAFRKGISDSHCNGYLRNSRNVTNELKIDYENNRCFTLKEDIVEDKKLSKENALKKAYELMGDEEYVKEMERIYSEENVKEFYCHPVHYHITAGNDESAKAMTDLLLEALHSNGRLLGRRISYVYGMTTGCYDEPDFDNLICNSQGATVILCVNTEKNKSTGTSDDYQEVAAYIGKLVNLYQKNVLFIFQEVANKNSIGKKILSEIDENVRMIELAEGIGTQIQAKAMLRQIIMQSEYAKFLKEDEELDIPMQDTYTLSEIYVEYNKWVHRIIYEKAYKSYGLKEKVIVEEIVESSPYEELNKMIGLDEVKVLVDQIIAMNKIQKKRKERGFDAQNGALHMLFTGNPGSAKTTVARLLTRILYEEGIIRNKKIVECGRSDLVGKYVGWTAKLVKSRFREARDGVLFIDEAYSLVDDRNGSFGDEAINTIVQEMENHRTDVIVIFAGYPEKMEAFLEKNEGLKSRITFHLDFPDYNKDELVEILQLMIKQKGYECEPAVFEKCSHIFANASMKNDFGNGRYVRNVLEHAIMKQSKRLMKEFMGSEMDEALLNCLTQEDFEAAEPVKESKKSTIGFQCI